MKIKKISCNIEPRNRLVKQLVSGLLNRAYDEVDRIS